MSIGKHRSLRVSFFCLLEFPVCRHPSHFFKERGRGEVFEVKNGRILSPYSIYLNLPGVGTPLIFSRRGDGGEVINVQRSVLTSIKLETFEKFCFF
jgi:hypothetical protein